MRCCLSELSKSAKSWLAPVKTLWTLLSDNWDFPLNTPDHHPLPQFQILRSWQGTVRMDSEQECMLVNMAYAFYVGLDIGEKWERTLLYRFCCC
jgi:hypothetical protein